ncbi:NADH-quinone oxidoreductase subunit NuoH [Rubeoparvulum massiliense]|uniref:NADH-quinone oxidoreductase subunit NuoH n=1 Tax=Rubeoparvulum massiliense TaxID=1631346 RepID=UPI00065E77AF|nr:NADH-quinone oxidoreductase subunit NuoH [Rubeoparvulum massiliense]
MLDWLYNPLSWSTWFFMFLSAVALLMIILGYVTYAIYFERKVIGWMQLRTGPNRVGPLGLFQTIADVLKLLIKEDVRPTYADRGLYLLAPVLAFMPSFAVLVIIPFSENIQFAYLNIGVVYYIALSSISIIGAMAGGWASNNKYSLMGGLRAAGQMISYEIPLALSIVGVVMVTGSLNLVEIVNKQAEMGVWFVIPQFLGFVIFLIAALAELSRTPFDLPEAESELVAGFHTEYSGFRFAMFMLGEYVYTFSMGALLTTLFFGGWLPLFGLDFIPGWLWFVLKMLFFVFFLFWLRATFPRVRVNELMPFAWKVLMPLSLLNIFLTAAWITWM